MPLTVTGRPSDASGPAGRAGRLARRGARALRRVGALDEMDRDDVADAARHGVLEQRDVVPGLVDGAVLRRRRRHRLGPRRGVVVDRRRARRSAASEHAALRSERSASRESCARSSHRLLRHVLEHLVGGRDRLRVHLVGALGFDHVHQLFHDVHVGAFERALLRATPRPFRPGVPVCAGPLAADSTSRFSPRGCRPAGLTKSASCSVPTCVGADWPATAR